MKRENAQYSLERLNAISKNKYTIYSAYGYHSLCMQVNNAGGQRTIIDGIKTYADLVEIINGITKILEFEK